MGYRSLSARFLAASVCISSCLGASLSLEAQESLITTNDTWRYFPGTEEPPFEWNTLEFDDSLWLEDLAGFGYGDNDDSTILNDMQNSYLSVYLRKKIEIEDVTALNFVQLGAIYDDGFVAYVNGVEIARSASMSAAGTPPLFDATSASSEAAGVEWFTITGAGLEAFQNGTNVICVQGHNTNLTSSDFSINPELRFYSSLCPSSIRCSALSDQRVRLTWIVPVRPAPFDAVEIHRDGELVGSPSRPSTQSFTDRDVPPGTHTYEVIASLNGEICEGDNVPSCTVDVEGSGFQFRRGDMDASGTVNLTDAIFLLVGLFQGGKQAPCPDSADADDNGLLNLTDAIFLLQHLFQGGAPVPPPGLENCGLDPSDDGNIDCEYTSC